MSKHKYHYDINTLTYKRIRLTPWDYTKRIIVFLVFAFLCGAFIFYLYYKFFDSLKEKSLKNEIKVLTTQYELMNNKIKNLAIIAEKIKQRDLNIYRAIFEGKPREEIKISGGMNSDIESIVNLENAELLFQTKAILEELNKNFYEQSKSLTEVEKLVKDKNKMLSSIPAIQPVSNKDLKRMASGYGYRRHPIYKTWKFHAGMDFTVPKGTPIYATGDGKVLVTKTSRTGLGNHVILDHGYGYVTVYAHMEAYSVKKNKYVKRGQIIGYVGNTGLSTGPHLHYEVRKNGKPINPINFYYDDLTPELYEKMLKLSSRNQQSLD